MDCVKFFSSSADVLYVPYVLSCSTCPCTLFVLMLYVPSDGKYVTCLTCLAWFMCQGALCYLILYMPSCPMCLTCFACPQSLQCPPTLRALLHYVPWVPQVPYVICLSSWLCSQCLFSHWLRLKNQLRVSVLFHSCQVSYNMLVILQIGAGDDNAKY